MEREINRKKRKRKQIREGMGEHSERHCAAVRWKTQKEIAQQRELKKKKKEEINIEGEQRKQLYDLTGVDNIKEVGIKAMWPARRSLHPQRCGVMRAARLHVLPAFGPKTRRWSEQDRLFLPSMLRTVTTEQSVPRCTDGKKKKKKIEYSLLPVVLYRRGVTAIQISHMQFVPDG